MALFKHKQLNNVKILEENLKIYQTLQTIKEAHNQSN